jgi:hypothetical protein
VRSRPAALAEDVRASGCTLDELPTLLSLHLTASDANGAADIQAAAGSNLELTVTNPSDQDAAVTLRAQFWSDAGEGSVSAQIGRVRAGSSTVSSIDPAVLRLPIATLETSGSLVLSAEGTLPGGQVLSSSPLPLGFHPVREGWRIYDVGTRETTYAGGALSEQAVADRDGALARLPAGVRLAGVSYGTAVGVSDSPDWRPTEEAPGESDGEGGAR